MRTQSVKKAAFIFMRTKIEPKVLKDNRTMGQNTFYFRNEENILSAAGEYMDLVNKQQQLVAEKDLWLYEHYIGILKKKCCIFKMKNKR